MEIVYIDFGLLFDSNSYSGIERKKLAQITELKKLGNVERLKYGQKLKSNFLNKISRRLPYVSWMSSYIEIKKDFTNIDFVYFRRDLLDGYVIRLFKKIKQDNPQVKLIVELPTYPYDKELKGILNYPLLIKEKFNRSRLHEFVDRIVLVTAKDEMVFKIPTILSLNGIDFSSVAPRCVQPLIEKQIHAIIVGNFTFYHGIDRIIEGMLNYFQQETHKDIEVFIHIIGSGKDITSYKEKCKKNKIDRYVIFYGSLKFNELEVVYNKVSIAINSLGRHRVTGTYLDSSIKSREYGAKGLPVITEEGIPIDYLPKDYPYVLTIPADDSPLDIFSIVRFHGSIYEEKCPEVVAQDIRRIAESRCSSETMMKPVLEYIKIEKNIDSYNRDVSSSILS